MMIWCHPKIVTPGRTAAPPATPLEDHKKRSLLQNQWVSVQMRIGTKQNKKER